VRQVRAGETISEAVVIDIKTNATNIIRMLGRNVETLVLEVLADIQLRERLRFGINPSGPMDFSQAVRAHSDWKMKLSAYLRRPDGTINAADLSKDNVCVLGQWIASQRSERAGDPVYEALKQAHTRFHKEAGSIARRATAGESVAEETALGANSEFAAASRDVVSYLVKMQRQAA
jgi:hypothetical protein